MFTTIKGIYNNGQITLCEPAPVENENIEVLITFTNKELSNFKKEKKPFTPGCMKGLVTYIASDFNEPLEELKEYM